MKPRVSFSVVLLGIFLVVNVSCSAQPTPAAEYRNPNSPISTIITTQSVVDESTKGPSDTAVNTPSSTVARGTQAGVASVSATEQNKDPENAIQLARATLAQSLNVPVNIIDVVSVTAVSWPDTSLGNPQPGQTYTPTIQPGFKIILIVDGQQYELHTSQNRMVVQLENGSAATMAAPEEPMSTNVPKSAPAPQSPGLEKLVAQAKEDLANRLTISPQQIALLETEEVVWPDASLGCPQPDMVYKQVPQDGVIIKLGFENQIYHYHSGGNRTPFLCVPKPRVNKTPPLFDSENQ